MAPRTSRRPDQPGGRPWRIEDVLARTDLNSLLNELAQPANHVVRGQRWHCPMPDHDDAHASVSMHTDRRGHERWRCWSGDDTHRGDAIDLVMATQRLERREAIDWLAHRAGLSADQPLPPTWPRKPPPAPAVVPLSDAAERYVAACEKILWNSSAGQPIRDWLHARGISPETAAANRLGADPGRDRLPRPRGLPTGNGIGATFPVLDQAGQLRYLQTRYLNPEPGGPKYDNPSSRHGTNPRLAWPAATGPARPDVLIVCEGIPDALIASQAGYQTVGLLGAQAPGTTLAARLATRADQQDLTLVAIADNDDAGHHWAARLRDLLTEHGQEVQTLRPPTPGHDLTDWALTDPHWPQAIDTTLDLPTPLAEPAVDLES